MPEWEWKGETFPFVFNFFLNLIFLRFHIEVLKSFFFFWLRYNCFNRKDPFKLSKAISFSGTVINLSYLSEHVEHGPPLQGGEYIDLQIPHLYKRDFKSSWKMGKNMFILVWKISWKHVVVSSNISNVFSKNSLKTLYMHGLHLVSHFPRTSWSTLVLQC